MNKNYFYLFLILANLLCFNPVFGQSTEGTSSNIPVLRLRLGFSALTVNAGDKLVNQPLNSAVGFMPTFLWDIPSFRSRLGVQYVAQMGSDYGAMPISGMGFIGYFYLKGISSAFEYSPDGILYQKSRPGFFVLGSLTPVNFNLNQAAAKRADFTELSIAATMVEYGVGVGYDYPFTDNMIFSGEMTFRRADAQTIRTNERVSYGGINLLLVLSTSYY